jgi:hypothetical protein
MLDDDPLPDLAVGRLPADNATEAEAMVRRIVAYETGADFGAWRKRMDIVAGPGGFGPLVDMFLESTFRKYVAELIPPAYDVRITYANPASPWCFPPPTFPEKVAGLLDEGSLVWAYVGHGSPTAFDRVPGEGGNRAIFDLAGAARMDVRRGAPVVAVIACSTGHFDRPEGDCVVEAMMKAERGPAAVIASTRVSQPYANGILAREMIARFLDPAQPTLGKAFLAVQQALVDPKGEDQTTLDRISGLLMGPEKLRACREDHVHLYALFGDPAMPIGRPRGSVKLTAPASAPFGGTVTVDCAFDRAYVGEAVVTLEARRGAPLRAFEPVKGLSGPARFEAMERNWRAANDLVVARAVAGADGDSLRVALQVPGGGFPAGEYAIKVFIGDAKGCAIGSARIALGEKKAGEEEGEGF